MMGDFPTYPHTAANSRNLHDVALRYQTSAPSSHIHARLVPKTDPLKLLRLHRHPAGPPEVYADENAAPLFADSSPCHSPRDRLWRPTPRTGRRDARIAG